MRRRNIRRAIEDALKSSDRLYISIVLNLWWKGNKHDNRKLKYYLSARATRSLAFDVSSAAILGYEPDAPCVHGEIGERTEPEWKKKGNGNGSSAFKTQSLLANCRGRSIKKQIQFRFVSVFLMFRDTARLAHRFSVIGRMLIVWEERRNPRWTGRIEPSVDRF